VLGDWPGHSERALIEGRDVAPANDLRALFKGELADHWGLGRPLLDQKIFPGSGGVAPLSGIIAGA
jgi:uncharacterized protein (DUF1501 family)